MNRKLIEHLIRRKIELEYEFYGERPLYVRKKSDADDIADTHSKQMHIRATIQEIDTILDLVFETPTP